MGRMYITAEVVDKEYCQAAWLIQQNPVVRPDAKVFLSHGVLLKDPPKHYAEAKVERILHDFFLLPYVKQYSKKTRVLLLPSFLKDILLYVLDCFLWLPLRVSMDVP